MFQNLYSFMPPDEPGWRVVGRNAHELAFVGPGANPDETFAIQGRVFGLPAWGSSEEFVELIRKAFAEQAADKRYTVVKHEVSADLSPQSSCARSHFVAQDHEAVRRSTGTRGTMVLEVMTRSCAHPKNRALAVTLVFSHRYYPGQADARLAEKAERLFSSVEYLE